MTDVQNELPKNELELEKVGVEGFKRYIMINRPDKVYQFNATINSYITLPSTLCGVHMSRFIESIEEKPFETNSIEEFTQLISLKAFEKHGYHCFTESYGELPYTKIRPSGKKDVSLVRIFASYSTLTRKKFVRVSLNGVLAYPCSKEMCNGLTHNQRGSLEVQIDVSDDDIELTDVVDICNDSFSVPTYSLLKRPEEKAIVEQMHRKARFVEDVTRKCVYSLRKNYLGRIAKVKYISYESIHDHNVCSEWKGVL